jgi:hypothetical protein
MQRYKKFLEYKKLFLEYKELFLAAGHKTRVPQVIKELKKIRAQGYYSCCRRCNSTTGLRLSQKSKIFLPQGAQRIKINMYIRYFTQNAYLCKIKQIKVMNLLNFVYK